MQTHCMMRKRIWEVDCWSLDAAIAASFDWREIVNVLQGQGHTLDLRKPEAILELQAQCLVHEYCHSENGVSVRIENLLNDWHERTILTLADWSPSEIAEYVLTASLDKKESYGALFWALGSDPREGFDCIRRRFHQRFQIYSIRKLL